MTNKCLEFLNEVEEMGYITSAEKEYLQKQIMRYGTFNSKYNANVENRLVVFECYDGVVYLNIPDVDVHLSR